MVKMESRVIKDNYNGDYKWQYDFKVEGNLVIITYGQLYSKNNKYDGRRRILTKKVFKEFYLPNFTSYEGYTDLVELVK